MQATVDAAMDAVAMTVATAAAMVAATATATTGTGECASLILDVCLQVSTSARLDLACLPPHPMLLRYVHHWCPSSLLAWGVNDVCGSPDKCAGMQ